MITACTVNAGPHEHIFGDWTVTKPVTETANGLKEKSCTICGYKITEEIAKLDHKHGTVATPKFSIAAGAVESGTSVTITCATAGTKIYYTTDGTKPTASSPEYTGAISITAAATINAIAVKDGLKDSAIASAFYAMKIEDFPLILAGKFKMGGGSPEAPYHEETISKAFYMCDHEVTQLEYQDVMDKTPSYFIENERPVETVNWYKAIVYCNRRSMNERLTPCYTISGKTNPNEWGLYDMTGNVWEWCWERFLRGCGYNSFTDEARIFYHFSLPPENEDWNTGFRAVRAFN